MLMAWQRHEKSTFGSGDQAPSTVSLAESGDGGLTWGNQRVAAGMIEGCVNVYSPSLYRCTDGTVSLFFKRYTHLVHGEPIRANVYRIDSSDEGATWGPEQTLWENEPYAPLNHGLKRCQSGAVLMPLFYSEGGWCGPDDHIYVSVLRSEDDFCTWTRSEPFTVPMRGLMEPCIAQRPDGTLNMVLRTQLGSVFYCESRDDGRTWSKPQTTGLHAPESCSCLATVPGTDVQLVVWNNAEYDMNWRSHYGKRTPLTAALSRDGLHSVFDVFDIENDPGRAYSNPSVTFTSDGWCLLNYWSCDYLPDGRLGPLIDLKLARFRIDVKSK
ncbi:MAG: exo-alpha-sialidase [Clostridia bacterium]|nr:exo-alpha-sialidase [Clostridia bacterium]